MRYPCHRVPQGRLLLAAMRGREGSLRVAQRAKPEWRETREKSSEVDLDEVLDSVRDTLRIGHAKRLLESGSTMDGVEGALSLRLHEEASLLPAQVLGDPDFWRYVALEVVREFVFWRDGEGCSQASFGLNSSGRIPDCVPLRMFNRAHIALSIEARIHQDARKVCTSGGTDFWQSHVLRVQNRYDPRIVAYLIAAMGDGHIRKVDDVRDVAKRVRQERSNLVLELLDDRRVANVMRAILKRRAV